MQKKLTLGCPTSTDRSIAWPPHLFVREYHRGDEKIEKTGEGCLLGESISSTWQQNCIYELSTKWMPKQDPHKENTNWFANAEGSHKTPCLDEELQAVGEYQERKKRYCSRTRGLFMVGDLVPELGSLTWWQTSGAKTDYMISTRIWSKGRDGSCLSISVSRSPLCGQNVFYHSTVISGY